MILFRAIHATKVLALAGLVIATSYIPMEARDRGGLPEVQTRTRHVRMNADRPYPRHDFDRTGYRNDRDRHRGPRSDWVSNGGPPEVNTRTRHVRLPRYRPDRDPAVPRLHERQIRDAVDVDQQRGSGQPEVHHRHQALPAG